MQVQFNSDSSVMGTENVAERIEASVREKLARFEERLTRIEIHVRDENGAKGGADDKACTIEARPRGGPRGVGAHRRPPGRRRRRIAGSCTCSRGSDVYTDHMRSVYRSVRLSSQPLLNLISCCVSHRSLAYALQMFGCPRPSVVSIMFD